MYIFGESFIDEDNTEVIKQMLLSERVWMYVDAVPTPLNVVDKSFKYKTRQKMFKCKSCNFETAEKVALKFDFPIIASMLTGKKIMHLEGVPSFEFFLWVSSIYLVAPLSLVDLVQFIIRVKNL